jgi:HEAT repeat protein
MPSPTTIGLGGGDITSGYVQQQFVRGLIAGGDPVRLMQALADQDLDPAARDAASLALAGKGDTSQADRAIEILRHSEEPYMRAMAAHVTDNLLLTTAIPFLEEALEDDYWVHAGSPGVGADPSLPMPERLYPVRRAAAESLRNLRDPWAFARKQQRLAEAQPRLEAAREQARLAPPPTPPPEVPLLKVLALAQSMYREERLTGVLALPLMEGPEVEPALTDALDDPEWRIRWRAIEGLGATAGSSAIPVLLGTMRAEWDYEGGPSSKGRRITMTGYWPQPHPVFLQDQIRVAMQRILERNGTVAVDNAYAALVKVMEDQAEAARVRTEIALLLAHFGDRRAIPVLIEGLSEDREGSIRAQCATALGELRAPEAIPALTAALEDPYKTLFRDKLAVRDAAQEALDKRGE